SDTIPVPADDTTVPTDDVPVHSSNLTNSMFDGKPTTRFLCPSNLGNHDPSPGIFSFSSYDDEFDTALNNVESSMEVLIDLPPGKYVIRTKWILKNKRDARGIVVHNKARLVAQVHRKEEGIDYDEVFAPVARIEAIRLFLAFASYMRFLVYQMHVKSAFLYERIEDEVYVTQPKGFVDPQHPKKVYKVVKALYGLHQAPRAWYATISTFLLKHGYKRGTIDKTLFLKKNNRGIILVQVYVDDIVFGSTKKEWCDEFETLMKGEFQMSVMGELTFFLGLCYPKESPLMLEAYSDIDYDGANKDRKSTTSRCQFLGRRLISWQCKKQTIVATSSTEAEYVAAANCYSQFWSMAILRAPELGPPAIMATIDRTPYIITEDLVRSSLQLADDRGVTDLPILKIYSGMDALGYVTEGEGAEVAAQDVPNPMPVPDQSLPHLTTPSRPQSTDPVAPVLEHDHSSTQPETVAGFFPSTEDAHMGGDFHTSPPRSCHTPLASHPLGRVEDPIALTALSFVVSILVQKVHSLEAKLHDHKKLFKDVMGKLVKKVKSLEVKLKTKKRKMVVGDSDEEDDITSNVDLDALCALANAAVVVDSDVPAATSSTPADASVAPGASSVAPGASSVVPGASSVALGASFVVPSAFNVALGASGAFGVAPGASGVAPGDSDVFHGVYVPPTATSAIPAATSAVPADDPTVPTVMEEDQLGEEAAKRLHKEEMVEIEREREEAQRKRQQETLLGDDMSEDNFPARMAALIKKKRQALAEQLFKKRQNRPLTSAQQKAYMRPYVKNQSCAIYNTGSVLEEPPTKKRKSPEASTTSMSEIPISPTVTSPLSSCIRRKSLGPKHVHKPKSTLPTLDLDAPAQTFLKVIVDEDLDDKDSVDEVWSAVIRWEILSTPLGDINALYRIDGYTKHFATLRHILYMVDRQDLMKLYGLVVQYYEHHTAIDVSYPLSVELMKTMLLHKLGIDSDFVGNDLTTAEQLIQFIKDQIVAAHASSV
nr:putative ribonuclease H-like domain-containing protein [Tanacetum cinerariifolium]